ncbi:type II toxin-antitoxin system YafQ family toxin [Agrilactobacillus fermenti]|uniref:type II toxin-antitoxin system RelE/ParE family toxin n=1 Tax=Agrilactobacillus fermenti TaxID=2586909 RepID=UPI003A5C1405
MSRFKLKVEPQFKKDYQVFKREHRELMSDFKVALQELKQTGRVPDTYEPHTLSNKNGLYNGIIDFHLSNGKVDVVILYAKHKTNLVIRPVRIGTHDQLFRGTI